MKKKITNKNEMKKKIQMSWEIRSKCLNLKINKSSNQMKVVAP